MTNNESKGPFEGLLVIDMTHVLNGPFGTQLLCNMGARVIKVEPPGHCLKNLQTKVEHRKEGFVGLIG